MQMIKNAGTSLCKNVHGKREMRSGGAGAPGQGSVKALLEGAAVEWLLGAQGEHT